MRQSSDEEQCQPTPSLDHAASRLVKIPGQGNTILFHSSQQLPCLCLGPLKDPFSVDSVHFKGPRLASCIASGTPWNQGHHQVCHARRRGPKKSLSIRADANLNCAFVAFGPRSLIVKSQQTRI